MTAKEIKHISKFLSLILRHKPEKIGLTLDKNGWAVVTDILEKSNLKFTMETLEEVVETNDKQRFSFNADKTKIRANQGHSLKTIDLEFAPQIPPSFLYHGTVPKFLQSIKLDGLKRMNRQHVHLSADRQTASIVGKRRGVPEILSIRSGQMQADGFPFYLSKNGVWLTDHVPPKYIDFKEKQ